MDLCPEAFFDLSDFEWRDIFKLCQNPWEAIAGLKDWGSGFAENFIHKGEGVVIEDWVKTQGLIMIGDGSLIESFAVLRGPVIIGKNCRIGSHSQIKNSIILDGTKVPHLNYVGDSVIGKNVNIGSHSSMANFSTLLTEVRIGKIKTGLRKFGAIIGDGSSLGCSTHLNPGTLIAKNSFLIAEKKIGPGFFSKKDCLKITRESIIRN